MPEPKRPLKVFLCHASTDKPKVRELYRYLKKRGIQPWFDEEDLVGGQDWQVEIPKALATSDAIIICLTKNSVDKEGYIQKEIKFALDKALEMPEGRIFLIPVKFEECEVPFTLSRYQWVDLTVESGYAKMMKALKFRASQLERSTVELPNKALEEENLLLEKDTREKEERLVAEMISLEKYKKQVSEENLELDGDVIESPPIQGDGNTIHVVGKKKVGRKRAAKKPQQKTRTTIIVTWIVLAVLVVGIVFLSSPNSPFQFSEPTPANTQFLIIPTPTHTKVVELGATPTLDLTSTPSSTLSPTPLPTEITDAKGVSMVLVPAGEFTMGSDNGSPDESPAHQVYLDSFYMDIYEVTNIAYKVCVDAGDCSTPIYVDRYSNSLYSNHPVVYVNWFQAADYCEWREANLPTEAQWEKAARGTDGRKYPWGEGVDCGKTNYAVCVGDSTSVGSYENDKSPYGIYDLAGNVMEWVADWYDINYYFVSPYENPLGPDIGDYRVFRGGYWNPYDKNSSSEPSATVRGKNSPSTITGGNRHVGFRCTKDVIP